uniref:Uncharacterized protein n=1 Tax=Anguilla anguilla TaxID=7936 RepID=A0A0E9XK44_ANGAN
MQSTINILGKLERHNLLNKCAAV